MVTLCRCNFSCGPSPSSSVWNKALPLSSRKGLWWGLLYTLSFFYGSDVFPNSAAGPPAALNLSSESGYHGKIDSVKYDFCNISLPVWESPSAPSLGQQSHVMPSKGNGYVWAHMQNLKLQRISTSSPLAVVKIWSSGLDVVRVGGDDEPPPPGLLLEVISLSSNILAKDHKLCVTVWSYFSPFPLCFFNPYCRVSALERSL